MIRTASRTTKLLLPARGLARRSSRFRVSVSSVRVTLRTAYTSKYFHIHIIPYIAVFVDLLLIPRPAAEPPGDRRIAKAGDPGYRAQVVPFVVEEPAEHLARAPPLAVGFDESRT